MKTITISADKDQYLLIHVNGQLKASQACELCEQYGQITHLSYVKGTWQVMVKKHG